MTQANPKQPFRIGILARDVIIVIAVPWLCGLVLGASGVPRPSNLGMIAWSIGFGAVGFATVSFLAAHARASHILHVSFGVWVYGLMTSGPSIQNPISWILSAMIIASSAVAGLGVRFGFLRITGKADANKKPGNDGK